MMPETKNNFAAWQTLATLVKAHPALPKATLSLRKLMFIRLLSENAVVFLLQYIGLMLSTLATVYSPLWFATGTAVAFVFLRGYAVLPGIFLGTFVAYILAKAPITVAVIAAVIMTLQAFLLRFFCFRYIAPSLIFRDRSQFIFFALGSALITAGSTWLLLLAMHKNILGLAAWLANFNGLLIFAYALITLDAYFPQIKTLQRANLKQVSILYLAMIIMTLLVLLLPMPLFTIFAELLLLCLTLTLSSNLGIVGSASALFILGFFYGMGYVMDAPLFTTVYALASLIFLQCFLCTTALLSLWLPLERVFSSPKM